MRLTTSHYKNNFLHNYHTGPRSSIDRFQLKKKTFHVFSKNLVLEKLFCVMEGFSITQRLLWLSENMRAGLEGELTTVLYFYVNHSWNSEFVKINNM